MKIEHGTADHFLGTWCASSHWCYFQRLQCTDGKQPLEWNGWHSGTCFRVWLPCDIQVATTARPRVLSQVQSVSSTAQPCRPNMVTSGSKKTRWRKPYPNLRLQNGSSQMGDIIVSSYEVNRLPTRDDKPDETQPSTIFHLHRAAWSGTLNCWGSLNSAWSNATLGKPPSRWFGCMWWHINGPTLCVRACVYACVHICPPVRSWPNGPSALAVLTENQWPTR